MNLKIPKTYEEQVSIICSKGFLVEDTASCISFLKHTNYYRLSAYFLPFRKKDGTYFKCIHFKQIQRIYDFDSRIRALLFQIIEQIEFYLRTQISYYLSHKYGALGYLNNSMFSKRHNSEKFNQKLNHLVAENQHTLVVKHHKHKYDGCFPIWVIIEFFSIGMLSYCYNDLHSKDQKAIARDSFSYSSSCLNSWFRCITDLRNRCAHYSRLYFWTFPAVPATPKESSYSFDRKLFSQILMLKYLYPDKSVWNARFAIEISALVNEYLPDISLKHIGFPENWNSLL